MKYLVEVLSTFRNVYVVEAENEEDALLVTENCDDNWQEWLGQQKLDVRPYTEEQRNYFKNKDKYFWEGHTSLDENGHIVYHYPDGSQRVDVKVK
jgi:hypothetical protein